MFGLLRRGIGQRRATARWPEIPLPQVDAALPVSDVARCDLNGACARSCPTGAITVGTAFVLDRAACISCGRCILSCGPGALAPGIAFADPGRSRDRLLVPPPPR